MSCRECAIVMAYTGVCMLEGKRIDYFYAYLEEIFGRKIYSHAIPSLADEIKKKSEQDFFQLCAEAKE